MSAPQKQIFTVGIQDKSREIAYRTRLASTDGQPGFFWMSGYKSEMGGEKALTVDALAAELGHACTRFDYSGHGVSGGDFLDGTISRWLEESLAIFETFTTGPQIILGSSMGGWLALLLTKAHIEKVGLAGSRIKGLILIAPAIDMTHDLMWAGLDDDAKSEILEKGIFRGPDTYGQPYEITADLIEDGKKHLFGDRLIETGCPVHILHGNQDETVPWQSSVNLMARIARDDVKLTLVKDSDHRLSRPEDLGLLKRVLLGMLENGKKV